MVEDWYKDVIRKRTEVCRVTTMGEKGKEYPYAILPLESRFDPFYLDAVTSGLAWMLEEEMKKANAIVSIEAKSFLVAPSLAKRCDKDCIVIRKRNYNVPDQIVIRHQTIYGKVEDLFCVGIGKGDKVVIFDDMISGGGTMVPTITELKKHCEVINATTLYDRGNGRKTVKKQTGILPKSLATIEVADGKVKVQSFYPHNDL
jgi:adenine phosphoribosyltransferase